MPRYIDADKLPELFDGEYKKTRCLIENGEVQLDNLAEGFTEATRVIRFVAKTEDVAPVIHAHWEPYFEDFKITSNWTAKVKNGKCSNCKNETGEHIDTCKRFYKYCPECGAKMDEEAKKHDCK